MRNSEEHRIQVALCQWMWTNGHRGFFAVPNGSKLSGGARAWSWLTAEGAKAGVPDLIIQPGLALEVKTKTGKRSPAQIARHTAMQAEGWTVLTGYGLKDCIEKLLTTGVGRGKSRG